VTYETWRRERGGEWVIIGSTKKQSYTDAPVTPGVFYEYKVRAVATKTVSNFSNTAVVYASEGAVAVAAAVAGKTKEFLPQMNTDKNG
jgi:hypothetical protein